MRLRIVTERSRDRLERVVPRSEHVGVHAQAPALPSLHRMQRSRNGPAALSCSGLDSEPLLSFDLWFLERGRHRRPTLVEAVEERCPDLLPTIAEELADSIGATRKFVEFILTFLPPLPDMRPAEGFRISWDPEELRRSLRTIYDYQSKALHTGVSVRGSISGRL
jgi:hypothetical protein